MAALKSVSNIVPSERDIKQISIWVLCAGNPMVAWRELTTVFRYDMSVNFIGDNSYRHHSLMIPILLIASFSLGSQNSSTLGFFQQLQYFPFSS